MFQDDRTGDTGTPPPSAESTRAGDSNVTSTAQKLRDFVSSIQTVDREIEAKNDHKKDIYKEIKSFGLDTNVVKTLIKRIKVGAGASKEFDDLLSLYEDTMAGRQCELPLSRVEASPAKSGRRSRAVH